MTTLKTGDKVPEILYKELQKNNIKEEEYKGKKIVLYFYPKDNTPGCTDEACNLRDNHSELLKNGYFVVGVSPDSNESHNKFKSKFSLPFPLLSDTEQLILNAFGVWGEKKNYGKVYMGVIRTTFIISENGVIEKVIEKVNTKEHSSQILND